MKKIISKSHVCLNGSFQLNIHKHPMYCHLYIFYKIILSIIRFTVHYLYSYQSDFSKSLSDFCKYKSFLYQKVRKLAKMCAMENLGSYCPSIQNSLNILQIWQITLYFNSVNETFSINKWKKIIWNFTLSGRI